MTDENAVPTTPADDRGESGQSTVEFIGGFVVLCAIILALLTLVDPVRDEIRELCRFALAAMRDGPG
ncbi:hypothetical protein GCM10009795_028780 [Nocardioides hankookensis]|uniref:DUF4244 domain-containing protein n=1 Tax=Nocardioides hankookensis TaxID=443157 RepID=A0ABW1LF99_9ACTN